MWLDAKPSLLLGLLVALAGGLVACPKKEPPVTGEAGPQTALAERGLADPHGLAAPGKGALLAQQCALACGARLAIDTGACTHACLAACASAADIAAIDACAAKTAESSPQL